MEKFKTYLNINEKWINPHHTDEHDEVHTQMQAPKTAFPQHVHKQLKHLSTPANFHKAMKSATTTHIHHSDSNLHKMGNTDVNNKKGILGNPEIEKAKANRVSSQYDNAHKKPMTKPIILHHIKSGHKHLLAGNTRLTHGVQDRKEKVPLHTIKY